MHALVPVDVFLFESLDRGDDFQLPAVVDAEEE